MRSGQFSRASHEYGASLSVVKPRDNKMGDLTPPEFLDPYRLFTNEQWKELTEDEDDILEILRR